MFPHKVGTDPSFNWSHFLPKTEPLEWSDEVAEPEGWAHLPAAALCQMSPYSETPLIRLQTLEKRRRFGRDLDPADPFL